ncbi:hypothetical protein CXIVA_02570 [Clostridium sp. SY8519]|jgi:stage V sporulation protein D (sporulation-specific penicillin-binding protein)|nr:hypothetical protein CXIVA_02570 [Clostridium sp. SY8519]
MARRKKRIKKFHLAQRMKKKLFLVFVAIVVLMVFLLARVAFIQLRSGDRYEKIVLSQQEYSSTTIPFRRGDIVDRKGTVLATSTDVYNVILDCSVITSKDTYLDPTLNALKECFGIDREKVKSYIEKHKTTKYYKLAKKLAYSKVSKFEKLQNDEKTGANIKGVWFEKEYIRKYPYDTLAASVLGFTTAGNEGIGGLEDYYNDTLNGTDGRSYGYLNDDSTYETTVKEATNGESIVSTIDVNIQSIVEDKIREFARKYSSNSSHTNAAKHIGVILMDPNSGEVLAMASYPSFSLNDPWSLTDYYSKSEIKKMSDDERLEALNDIWQNFCTTTTYEPGSTFKPFTVAAGLESGKLTGNETYYCSGVKTISGEQIHCDNRSGHGTETIAHALRDSCNVSLMDIGLTLGAKTFSKYQHVFNFGLKTNIDLPGEARTDSLLYSEQELNKINLATNSFGQNFNVTMVQVISAYCSLVNGGNYYQPHMVSKIEDDKENVVETKDATLLRKTVSESTSKKLISYLQEVTGPKGTGKTAKVKGYSMTGKTGTAEKQPRGRGNYLVSFEGAVPAKNPQVAIYCVVDEPNAADQAHSTYAQGIVKSILKEVLPYMNIQKDEK